MERILCLKDTYLKKSPRQANSFISSRVHKVQKNTSYDVDYYEFSEGGHFFIKLSWELGDWFIYSPHWKLSWEDNEEDPTITSEQKKVLEQELSGNNSYAELDWSDFSSRVSSHFRVYEVCQGDERRIPTNPSVQRNIIKVSRELERVREEWKQKLLSIDDYSSPAIAVTSWYRPPEINASVGGVSNSQHINGSAVDIYPVNGKGDFFEEWLDKEAWFHYALGYGQKSNRGFSHIDLRDSISEGIRWYY